MFDKNKLILALKENGTNPHDLSKRVGISHTTITRLVNGENKDMKLTTAFKLADALGIDVNYFRRGGER